VPENEPIDWALELRRLLDESGEAYTWVTGKMELILRSGETIEGELVALERDDSVVVMDTAAGPRRVDVSEVVNTIIQMASPGAE
jgi:hypothetical protein